MTRFRVNVALSVKGDRIEKGQEVELTAKEASTFDTADLTPVDAIPAEAPKEEAPVAVEDMNVAQLKERASELGLSTSGTKADLQERIALHLSDTAPGGEPEGD